MVLKLRDARYFDGIRTRVTCLDALCLFPYSYSFVNLFRRSKLRKSRYPHR